MRTEKKVFLVSAGIVFCLVSLGYISYLVQSMSADSQQVQYAQREAALGVLPVVTSAADILSALETASSVAEVSVSSTLGALAPATSSSEAPAPPKM